MSAVKPRWLSKVRVIDPHGHAVQRHLRHPGAEGRRGEPVHPQGRVLQARPFGVTLQLHRRNNFGLDYAVRRAGRKLALYQPGEEQRFDLVNDLAEPTNLYAQRPDKIAELRLLLDRDLALS